VDHKKYLTNKAFCPIPWTGLMYNFNGEVKNCIRSAEPIGNLRHNTIEEILLSDKNKNTQANMLNGIPEPRCNPCYSLEGTKNNFDIISDRVFYLKELKSVDHTTYKEDTFNLHTIDVRWSNLCNFACAYCYPDYSSRWATELNVIESAPTEQQRQQFKEYVFSHADQLKHVYLAGGEPLLIKENFELLTLLKEVNPNVNLRINTNLSKVDTKIFDLICTFSNVHWIVSVESIEQEYEYIRWGGVWTDFLDNLITIKKLNHKISFNMLHFLLNYKSIFNCIRFLRSLDFHDNSFIIGPLSNPDYLNIRHLSKDMLESVKQELQDWISQKPGFLLENGLKNMLQYVSSPIEKNIGHCIAKIAEMDQRRNINSRAVFANLYKEIELGN
jgi:MoaA/NifB/PqqE/SkfB family radical SAM enzyme